MWYYTDIANWFDKNRAETDRILDRWVEDSNFNQGIMIVAATRFGSKEFVSAHYQRFKHLFVSKHKKIPKPIEGLSGIYSLKRLSELL